MDYSADRNSKVPLEEPSINEMTEKAIELLSTNPNGYFLLVEGNFWFDCYLWLIFYLKNKNWIQKGGKIDHGHHNSNAKRALDDYAAFDDALGKALDMVSLDESIVVVTADHSHV